MDPRTKQAIAKLAQSQKGVITRAQALERGLSPRQIHHQVQSDRWQRIHRGVYLTNTGRVDWLARAWAALLRAGPGAALSHSAAAHVWGLDTAKPSILWIAVPEARTIVRPTGARVVRRRQFEVARRKGMAVTTVRQTVWDLTAQPGFTLDETAALLGRAAQQDLLDPDALLQLLDARGHHPMSGQLRRACADAGEGVESSLESRILHRVIRAHGLAGFELQVPVDTGPPEDELPVEASGAERDRGGAVPGPAVPGPAVTGPARRRRQRNDLRNRGLGIRVEGDGVAWHGGDRFHEDRRRDRQAAAAGDVTVRVTWDAVEEPCEVALDLACTMTHRGWDGTPTRCGPSCDVPEQWAARTGRQAS